MLRLRSYSFAVSSPLEATEEHLRDFLPIATLRCGSKLLSVNRTGGGAQPTGETIMKTVACQFLAAATTFFVAPPAGAFSAAPPPKTNQFPTPSRKEVTKTKQKRQRGPGAGYSAPRQCSAYWPLRQAPS